MLSLPLPAAVLPASFASRRRVYTQRHTYMYVQKGARAAAHWPPSLSQLLPFQPVTTPAAFAADRRRHRRPPEKLEGLRHRRRRPKRGDRREEATATKGPIEKREAGRQLLGCGGCAAAATASAARRIGEGRSKGNSMRSKDTRGCRRVR